MAAAVAGLTGFAVKHFLNPNNTDPLVVSQETKQRNLNNNDPGNTVHNANLKDSIDRPLMVSDGSHKSGFKSVSETLAGTFTFSSSESLRHDGFRHQARKKPVIRHRGLKRGVRIPKVERGSDVDVRSEQRKGGKRSLFCLKRKKTTKSPAGKAAFQSTNDSSLFDWGLCYGIMYMMSAGKAEISKLNKAMDETTEVVEELKSELHRRKSSRTRQILNSVNNIDMNSHKMCGEHEEVMLQKTNPSGPRQ